MPETKTDRARRARMILATTQAAVRPLPAIGSADRELFRAFDELADAMAAWVETGERRHRAAVLAAFDGFMTAWRRAGAEAPAPRPTHEADTLGRSGRPVWR